MSRGLQRAQQQLLHVPYLPSLRTRNLTGPNGGVQIRNGCVEERLPHPCSSRLPTRCARAMSRSCERRVGPSFHQDRTCEVPSVLVPPFLWTNWPWTAVLRPPSLSSGRVSGGRSWEA